MGRTTLPKLIVNAWEQTDLSVPFNWKSSRSQRALRSSLEFFFTSLPHGPPHAPYCTALKEGGKTATRHHKGWSGKAIVAFQIALSTLLVVGSALFLRTLINLN